jgi:hypothetical protein
MGLEKRPDQGAETAAPPVGVRVIEDEITAAGNFGESKFDVFRINKEGFMAQDSKPPADRLGALTGRIYRMNDADSHNNSQNIDV